jgi:hypothetical protein
MLDSSQNPKVFRNHEKPDAGAMVGFRRRSAARFLPRTHNRAYQTRDGAVVANESTKLEVVGITTLWTDTDAARLRHPVPPKCARCRPNLFLEHSREVLRRSEAACQCDFDHRELA